MLKKVYFSRATLRSSLLSGCDGNEPCAYASYFPRTSCYGCFSLDARAEYSTAETRFQAPKCRFFARLVLYYGHKVNTERNKMDYYNIEAFDATGLVKPSSPLRARLLAQQLRGGTSRLPRGAQPPWPDGKGHRLHLPAAYGYRPCRHPADAGMNTFWRSDPVEPADGIITNERGLLLTSMESDCTPVYLLDTVNKGRRHGPQRWKGTASLIAVKAVEKCARSTARIRKMSWPLSAHVYAAAAMRSAGS